MKYSTFENKSVGHKDYRPLPPEKDAAIINEIRRLESTQGRMITYGKIVVRGCSDQHSPQKPNKKKS